MERSTSGKAENLFAEIGRKIDEIMENTKEGRAGLKNNLEDKIQELKKGKENLEKEFQEFTSNDDGKWTDVKDHLENAVKEIKEALEVVFKRKNLKDQE